MCRETIYRWQTVAMVLLLSSIVLLGCGSPKDISETSLTNDKTGQMLFVGQTLWNGDRLYGKIIETRPSHTFENGVTEAGVLVDFSGRADMEGSPPPPLWMPARSAATMARSGR